MWGARFLAGAVIAGLATPAAAQAPAYLSCTYRAVDQRADPVTSVYRVSGGQVRLWLRERWQEPLDHCDLPTAETDELTRQFIAGTTCAISVNEREISASAATTVEGIVTRELVPHRAGNRTLHADRVLGRGGGPFCRRLSGFRTAAGRRAGLGQNQVGWRVVRHFLSGAVEASVKYHFPT